MVRLRRTRWTLLRSVLIPKQDIDSETVEIYVPLFRAGITDSLLKFAQQDYQVPGPFHGTLKVWDEKEPDNWRIPTSVWTECSR